MKKICFDIGGSSIKVITFDENNKIILKEKIDHIGAKDNSVDDKSVNKISDAIKNLKMLKRIPLIKCLENIANYITQMGEEVKVGITIPGVVDSKNYKVLSKSAISDVDEDILGFFKQQKLVKQVLIENDGRAAAIGEMVYGQNKKITNAAILTVGSGIGGGIIINKKVYKGSHLTSGEFGKTMANISDHGSLYPNLSVGFLSTTAMCFRYTLATKREKLINGHELMQLVEQKDSIATHFFNNWIKTLTRFLINVSILDPDKILIGGGISANETFMNALKNEVNNLDYSSIMKFNVEACKLSNDAACYGMLALIEKEYIEE
ncbi:ROK family protein [Williamsoniiplasma luminosum]|uniref:ROK family protein n=1 Tax=Williamsoniiplasma luminosum TaxID=214888 RepID=A0A2S0NKA6_9MOLU|nr:ROK family protein [Williamsoniiplasma luminosum]AVP49453.1 MAG: hypothetical protein C5T88_02645 [Williamsoniiplasma luminosum]